MESHEPVEPAPLPVARVVKSDERRTRSAAEGGAEVGERDIDLRTRAQKACDKLPSCNTSSSWCDIGGCDVPCRALELLSALDGCDLGCG